MFSDQRQLKFSHHLAFHDHREPTGPTLSVDHEAFPGIAR